jgi:hypothetical protein
VSNLDGLLPKSLFTLSKTFLIPAVGGIPGALKTRPPGPAASGIQSAYLPLREQKRFNDRSKGFGQQPVHS